MLSDLILTSVFGALSRQSAAAEDNFQLLYTI